MEPSTDQPPASRLKNLEKAFGSTLLILAALVAGYYISYYFTFQANHEGTNFSNFKNDILVEQSTNILQEKLANLGYRSKEIIPLGTHRSTSYYADVMNGFSPQLSAARSGVNEYLIKSDLHKMLLVKMNERNEIVSIDELKE